MKMRHRMLENKPENSDFSEFTYIISSKTADSVIKIEK